MNRKDILRMCLQNLRRRKSRTFLTVLGVIIGCCSIVIMISLGFGMQESQDNMLAQMGDLTIITVYPPQSGGTKAAKLDDDAVKNFRQIPNVEAATAKLSMDGYSVSLGVGVNNRYVADWTTVAGMSTDAISKLGYQIIKGDPLTGKTYDVLVGQSFAYNFRDTFRPEGSNYVSPWNYDDQGNQLPAPDPFFDPVGQDINMTVTNGDTKFTVKLHVVGVVKEDYNKGYETSQGIIMNIDDVKALIQKAQGANRKKVSYSSIIVKATSVNEVGAVESAIQSMKYSTNSMESIRKPLEKEARQKQLMLGGLGAISLFVAALGITNTMIMSISERTREIGIMKALGCYVRDIRTSFLTEAGIIGLMGGIIGCILSFLISIVINMVSFGPPTVTTLVQSVVGGEGISRVSVIPPWLMIFAVIFSIFIGLGSGYYPANKAVKISALEAIKDE